MAITGDTEQTVKVYDPYEIIAKESDETLYLASQELRKTFIPMDAVVRNLAKKIYTNSPDITLVQLIGMGELIAPVLADRLLACSPHLVDFRNSINTSDSFERIDTNESLHNH